MNKSELMQKTEYKYMLNVDEIARRCYRNARDKGFHTTGQTFGDKMMLAVSELAEALEEYRNGHATDEVYYVQDKQGNDKPEGIPIEIADCIIRLFDNCEFYNIDIVHALNLKMTYNEGREHLHGGKIL